MLKDPIKPSEYLYSRAHPILGEVSFGLEIVSLDVQLIMQSTPKGIQPVWGIIYQAKGALIGTQNYNTQVTTVDDPWTPDEVLRNGLSIGCQQLLHERQKQLNGRG